jgi:hypothetical protein
MKTKILKFIAAVAVPSLLAGCIVMSVYPFYTPKDLVSDPGLAGRWNDASQTNSFWQFTDAGGKRYTLTTTDDQATNGFDAHLFQLKKYKYLDLLATNRDEFQKFQMPVHLISKVTRTDDGLSLQFMDYGWLWGLLETNPAALRHIIVPESADDTNNGNMVYLTADTKELQKFLLKHAEDTNAFNSKSAVELKRVP